MVHSPAPEGHGARQWNPRRAVPPDVAAMLAEARRNRGWSIREAARRAGVTPGTIVHLEAARRAPSIIVAEDIIEAYGLPPRDAARLRNAAVTDAGRSSPLRARY
jgi:transcriptional regulator with XRE-family HTH domain